MAKMVADFHIPSAAALGKLVGPFGTWRGSASRLACGLASTPVAYGIDWAVRSAPCTASNSFNTPRNWVDSSAFAPSDLASLGSSWTSRNTPSTPAPTAARASRGINSGWPPLVAAPSSPPRPTATAPNALRQKPRARTSA